MRCIINVSIGQIYIKKQKDLADSLKGRFDGNVLLWTEFPNKNYSDSVYNCKAAAFEEAIRQGYTQILWVDSPVVALQDVSPIFERITKDGYLTLENFGYNCAQTCSDDSLNYFALTRDQAEKHPEYASGIIGINTESQKGRALIRGFIEACKAGVAEGSRYHDGQSNDPRFLFHRQDQSVLSLVAAKLDLPPTMKWNEGITLVGSEADSKTILCWKEHGVHRLEHVNIYHVVLATAIVFALLSLKRRR
jgi:hypothetical protein